MEEKDWGFDMIKKRPCTPRDQYSILTETQIKNIRNNPHTFFHNPHNPGARNLCYGYPDWDPNKRHTITRTVKCTSQHLYRGHTLSNPVCWIGEPYSHDVPVAHNTARLGASVRWGPSKTGERTAENFKNTGACHRYMNIDMYRRHPSNLPGQCIMRNGRPGEGYYQQRNPNEKTWFGSSVPLNRTEILIDVQPKTFADYRAIKKHKQTHAGLRTELWPEYSEYTDRFNLESKIKPQLTHMEKMKLHVQQPELYEAPGPAARAAAKAKLAVDAERMSGVQAARVAARAVEAARISKLTAPGMVN